MITRHFTDAEVQEYEETVNETDQLFEEIKQKHD